MCLKLRAASRATEHLANGVVYFGSRFCAPPKDDQGRDCRGPALRIREIAQEIEAIARESQVSVVEAACRLRSVYARGLPPEFARDWDVGSTAVHWDPVERARLERQKTKGGEPNATPPLEVPKSRPG